MIKRTLKLPERKSCFLFGPRQTGKSTLVQSLLSKKDLYINLLPQRTFLAYAREGGRFRDEIKAHTERHGAFTCVVDEIQRLPDLLNEVHDLIESTKVRFLLTGSSARKLRRGASNLLAGRAYTRHLHPLTPTEIGRAFDLERALRFGCLPALWNPPGEENEREFLGTYADVYLREEIQEEGIVRKIGPFARFLDVAAANDGQIVNYSTVARDCGVSVKTAQQYYQILDDTFLVLRVDGWHKSVRKQLITHPKYYLFDTGVTNALTHQLGPALNPEARGRRFEQLVVSQVRAAIDYLGLDLKLHFWRTNAGAEVDLLFVRGNRILCAAEIKSSDSIASRDFRGLRSFSEAHPRVPLYLLVPRGLPRRAEGGMAVRAWTDFIEEELPHFT